MDLHISSKSISALASMAMVTDSTSASHAMTSCSRNEKASILRKVSANKVTGLATDTVANEFTMFCFLFCFCGLIKVQYGLDFLPYL